MSRKNRNRRKNRDQQSGYTGKGDRIDRGPVVQRIPVAGTIKWSPGRNANREALHPSLRDLPDDAEIKVIMIPPGSDPPEGRAGDLLGTLQEPYPMPDGDIVPAGSAVYRDLRPDDDPEAVRGRVPGGLVSGRQHISLNLARDQVTPSYPWSRGEPEHGRTVRGSITEPRGLEVPWAREHRMGEVPFRVMRTGPGEEPLTVHLRPEDVTRELDYQFTISSALGSGRRVQATSSGHSTLPGWFEPHDPEPPVIHQLRPGEILDVQSRLAGIMASPPERLLEFFDAFVSDILDKAGAEGGDWEKVNRWASMFWPAQTAPEWCSVLARQLRAARTYQVTAPMVATVHRIYEAVADRVAHVDHDDLPWPAGFAYLDRPVAFTDKWGHVIYNRAYSWDVVYLPFPEGRVPGVRVVSWSHPEDRDSYWSEANEAVMREFGGLGMGNTIVFPFGQRISVAAVPGRPRQDSVPLWLRCLWATLESVIAATRAASHEETGRQARHRAKRASLKHDEVHVVTLRRSLTLPAEGDGIPRNVHWTCRWFVDSFWRHARRDPHFEEPRDEDGRIRPHHAIPDAAKEHCALCGMRISYVATYDKGPPGLPYKKDRQLYRLAR